MRTTRLLALLLAALPTPGAGQQQEPLTRADTLRGTLTPERSWWDVVYYDLSLRVDPSEQSVSGSTRIRYAVTGAPREMQIDLAAPLQVDSVVQQGARLQHRREGDVLLVQGASGEGRGPHELTVHFRGRPAAAVNPPWDGGLIWSRDPEGRPWIATACQGLGASVWWPTKDLQSDEPDSQRIALTVPDSLQAVANGRLRAVGRPGDGWTTYEWFVSSPINNYDVAASVGTYAPFVGSYDGEGGQAAGRC